MDSQVIVGTFFLTAICPSALSLSLPTQEHWAVRSKGLLQDFAYGQLSRVRQARARALSGGDSQDEEENKDYDLIRGETEFILFSTYPFLPQK